MKKLGFRLFVCTSVAMLAALGLAVLAQPAFAVETGKTIRNDATGGDCTKIGTWIWWGNSGRCTLDRDLVFAGDGIVIDDDNIELKGDGHTISSNKTGIGVNLNNVTGATVYNINITSFHTGLRIQTGSGNYIMWGCNLTNNLMTGLFSYNSSGNQINSNNITGNKNGISAFAGSLNYIGNNNISSNSLSGIYLYSLSRQNNIHHNTFSSNGKGLYLYNSNSNTVYQNNFLSNATQAQVTNGVGNIFSYGLPTGGNHWSNWTSPDANGDGIVDSPYVFTGGQDNMPWTTLR